MRNCQKKLGSGVFIYMVKFDIIWWGGQICPPPGNNRVKEKMLCNPFLISTISTCPLEYQLKMAFFCNFHIIFTGFSLSWTRRVLRQARIRDVKYYINSELSPVLKGVFPQTTGCTLESGPSLHSRSNCFWGDIALALHTPRRLRHEKTMVQKGRGTKSFWYTVRQSFNEK